MEEIWRVVQEFPDYSVSSAGKIRNDRRQRLLVPFRNTPISLSVGLSLERRRYTRSLPKLVAEAFVPKPSNPWFNCIIHLDGDWQNCSARNLVWRPLWFAQRHKQQFKFEHRRKIQPIYNVETGEVFTDVWRLIRREGLLYHELVAKISEDEPVFPIGQRFDWLS